MQLKLKELRLSKGLTQAQVAEAVDISAANYSRYESNINEPPLAVICKLADFFNCSVDYILNRTEYNETASSMVNSVNSVLTIANKKLEFLDNKIAELDYLANQAKEQVYIKVNNKIQELDYAISECLNKRKEIDNILNYQEYQTEQFEKNLNELESKLEHLKSILKI